MASLAEIRDALAATIEAAIDDLQGYAKVPESMNLPGFVVVPRATDFMVSFARGTDTYEFDCIVMVSRRDDELAQHDLDDYVTGAGDKSIRQAVWNTKNLGLSDGTAATVLSVSQYGAQFSMCDIDHVGAVLRVQVITPGTA